MALTFQVLLHLGAEFWQPKYIGVQLAESQLVERSTCECYGIIAMLPRCDDMLQTLSPDLEQQIMRPQSTHINIGSKTIHKRLVPFILQNAITAQMKDSTDGIFRYVLLTLRAEFGEKRRFGK
jgi:hypothetical protein